MLVSMYFAHALRAWMLPRWIQSASAVDIHEIRFPRCHCPSIWRRALQVSSPEARTSVYFVTEIQLHWMMLIFNIWVGPQTSGGKYWVRVTLARAPAYNCFITRKWNDEWWLIPSSKDPHFHFPTVEVSHLSTYHCTRSEYYLINSLFQLLSGRWLVGLILTRVSPSRCWPQESGKSSAATASSAPLSHGR